MKIRVDSDHSCSGRSTVAARRQACNANAALRWLLIALCWLLPAVSAQAGMRYVYDDNGRLVAAVRDDGAASRYTYDSVGNIVSIDGVGAGDLVVFGFSPTHGDVGQAVTLTGANFAALASGNVVRFAGVAATVVSSSSTQIVTSVPAGAVTGKVTVVASGASAASAIPFTVDGTGHPPVITQVYPLVASAGSTISLTGTYLNPVPDQTSVRLNSYVASTSSLDDSHAAFSIAPGVGSGKVSVTTPFGRAVSANDILVAPPGIAPADVSSTQRMIVDGAPINVAVAAPSKYSAVLFDTVGGSALSLQLSTIAPAGSSLSYSVYDSHNSLVMSGAASASGPSVHLPYVKQPGTFLLLVSSSAPLSLSMQVETAPVLTGSNASVHLMTSVSDQSKRMIIPAKAGENLGFAVTGVTTSSGYNDVLVTLTAPNGAYVNSTWCYSSVGCSFNLINAIDGKYVAVITSEVGATMGFTGIVSRDVEGPNIPRDAPAVTFSTNVMGQNGWMTFDAVAGETIALNVSNQMTTPANGGASYTVLTPDGSALTSFSTASWDTINLTNLPATGRYKIYVDPASTVSSMAVNATVRSGIHSALAVEGPSQSFATTTPSQAVYVTFDSAGGENLGLGITDITTDSAYNDVLVQIYDPLGQYVASSWCYTATLCSFHIGDTKPGTYSLVVTSETGAVMGFAGHVTRDVVGPKIPRDNGVATLQLTKQAQSGWMTFDGVAGETIALNFTGQTTTPAGQGAGYTIYQPDGTVYTSFSTGSWSTQNLTGLPATGTYKVFVNPSSTVYGMTVQASITSGVHGVLAIEGPSQSFATTTPSQAVYVTFDSAGGENLGLGITDITTDSAYNDVLVQIYDPLGQYVASSWCYTATLCSFHIGDTKPGTYSLVVTSETGAVMGFAGHVTRDVVGPKIPRDNGVATLQLTKQAQSGWMTFDGVAGETIALNFTGQTTTPAGQGAGYTIYQPDGTVYTSFSTGSWSTQNLTGLPATGTYKVFVNPSSTVYGMTVQASITSGVHGVLAIEGPSQSFATTTPSQAVYVTFDSAGGENLGLGITDITTDSAYNDVLVQIYDPLGQYVASSWCYTATLCSFHIGDTKPGTYSLVVTSETGAVMGFAGHVTRDVVGPKIPRDNGVATLQLTKQAQSGWMTFDGVAGETIALNFTGQTTTPAGQGAGYTIYQPDGTVYTSFSTGSWSTQNLTGLPATGTYKVFVNPSSTAYGLSVQAAASSGVEANLILDGPVVGLQTVFPSQSAYLTYTATDAGAVNFNITDITTTSVYRDVLVSVADSAGSNVGTRWCNAGSDCVFAVSTTPGIYRVVVGSEAGDTMGFSASITRQ